MENEIKLENLLPSVSTFKLNRFDDFEFTLKPCTGGMLMDMNKKIGNVEKMLSIPSAENVSKISMMLMSHDCQLKFKKQKVKIIDVLTGDEIEEEMGGYKILMHSIEGINEQYDVYRAILESLGYGHIKANEIIKELKDSMNKVVNEKIGEVDSKKKSQKVSL